MELLYGDIDLETESAHVFADTSFATKADLSSQSGFVVLFVDQDPKCFLITWLSSKCWRVNRYVLAAELYAIENTFDVGLFVIYTLEFILTITV